MQAERTDTEVPSRTLGAAAALSIATGTMIGAGVFVFPGVAAGRAGPSAMLSFALGGAVAFVVAACTAELATCMPRNGGGYHYASRCFGPFVGVLVGVAQPVGLVFASAFYLAAFGRYTADLVEGAGLAGRPPAWVVASATALLLTGLNVLGASKAGRLQSLAVAALGAMLVGLFGYGALDVVGAVGEARPLGPFAPEGATPILTTAALVFTSYLGFVQVATVAGEVRRPQRNLPLALMGSVALVTLLYVLALFVTTGLLSPSRAGTLGEKATIEVARMLLGAGGGTFVLCAGVLATLSSANASILSSSRALQVLARDGHAPRALARLHGRFGSPFVALVAVGAPIAGLATIDRLETLASVASALHLVIYGVICAALWQNRRLADDDAVEADVFRVPAGRAAAGLGVLTCAGLLVVIEPPALVLAGATLAAGAVWYGLRALRRPRGERSGTARPEADGGA